MPVNRTWIRLASETHLALYRLSNGFIGGNMLGGPVLLLTTTGRKTGREHTSPLLYVQDGDDYVIIASNGGNASHPSWYKNLRKHPDAEAQVRAERHRVRAEDLQGAERERLYQRAIDMYRGYDQYQREARRTIPVVRLRVVDDDDTPG